MTTGVRGVGVDIVDLGAFAASLAEPGTRLTRAFSPTERRQCRERADARGVGGTDDDLARHLAGRWAVKEAVVKAWSAALYGRPPAIAPDLLRWSEIETVCDAWGRPSVRLGGEVAGLRRELLVARERQHGDLDRGQPAVEPQHPAPKGTKGEGTYTAKHIIVATGARPRALPGIEPDGKLIWTYFEAMKPEKMPKSMVVMGSGAIGIEFASFYLSMGVDVTVVELMPNVMPVEDDEISKFARKMLEKRGMKIITEAKVSKVDKAADSITAHVETKDGKVQQITADRLISAVGVQGNIENLGLETVGVKTDRGCIVIDGYGKTNVPGLYAIGDVAGPPMLAHKAEHEGVVCIEKIAGLPNVHPMDKGKIPGCTYCNPQVASVGLTEAKAKEQGRDIRVGRYQFNANGKAILYADTVTDSMSRAMAR